MEVMPWKWRSRPEFDPIGNFMTFHSGMFQELSGEDVCEQISE